jgi:5-methylcytosine-specific restriction endonuclease McrA
MKQSAVLSLYGNAAIPKGYCPSCQMWAFIIDGKLRCCGKPYSAPPTKIKREIEPEFRRRRPGIAAQRAILDEQGHVCLYCGQMFGIMKHRRDKTVKLRLVWDHLHPYVSTADNHSGNFVAACQICNGIKSDHIYHTLDEARLHIQLRREEKGYDF